MRILDELGKVLTNPDLDNGKLVEERRPITHRYEVTQHEQGHYEVIAEYPNGGKDVEWVVDVPEEGRWVAYGEDGAEVETDSVIPDDAPHEIDIPDVDAFYRYVLCTAEELAERASAKVQAEIVGLKRKLEETDYISAKMNDTIMACTSVTDILEVVAAHQSQYADIIRQRQQWRDEINALEAKE